MKGSKPAGTSEPLGVSPREASRLSSICLTNIYALLKSKELESTLIAGRRVVIYSSLKKLLTADKALQQRRADTSRSITPAAS